MHNDDNSVLKMPQEVDSMALKFFDWLVQQSKGKIENTHFNMFIF